MYLDHIDPRWQATINTRFWKSYSKKQEARNPLLISLWDVVEASVDYFSYCPCSPRVELSTEKSLPSIVTDEFFFSWLDCYFLFNLPSRKLTTKHMACSQQLHSHTAHKLAFSFSPWAWHSIYPNSSFVLFLSTFILVSLFSQLKSYIKYIQYKLTWHHTNHVKEVPSRG